jgi:hypothetical protein
MEDAFILKCQSIRLKKTSGVKEGGSPALWPKFEEVPHRTSLAKVIAML